MSSRHRWAGSRRIIGSPRPTLNASPKIHDRRRRRSNPSIQKSQPDNGKIRNRQPRVESTLTKGPSAAYLTLHPLSPIERLPTELLHRIFLEAAWPAFASASLSLAFIFQSRHLQFHYLLRSLGDLRSLVKLRFFTFPFLEEFEARYGEIDASDVCIPPALSALPWDSERLLLLRTLISRGASCEAEMDLHRQNMHDAIRAGRGEEVTNVLLTDPKFRPDAMAVEISIRFVRDVDDCLRLCTILADGGAPVQSMNVWRAALSRHENEFVQFLLERTAPPVEILGQLVGI